MKKLKLLSFLSILALLIFGIGCSKDDEPEPTTGTLIGNVTDGDSGAALSDVQVVVFDASSNSPSGVSAVTDGSGNYMIELDPGNYFVKASKQGYENSPPAAVTPISFAITVGMQTMKDIEMFASSVTNGGWISGVVTAGGAAVAGALVVADDGSGNGYSSVSDAEGKYNIFNVPAGTYSVKAWAAGYNAPEVSASVTSGAETASTDISATAGASGSVSGQITFLATGNIEVDVALTHPSTGETIPGLSTTTTASAYLISNVPDGTYLARASYDNDGIVMDPDWIIKNGEPFVTVSGGAVERPFSVTNSVLVISPSNDANSVEPVSVASTTPTFEWTAYSSTTDYVIEVTDGNGNLIWGGIDRSGVDPVKSMVIPGSELTAVYNFDGLASVAELESGKTYRWRVYASKDSQQSTVGWELISVSEDQRGLFTVE